VGAYIIGKTEIKIYGGFNTVGGNCIVVKSPSGCIMLDQGVNFSALKKFYGFWIQPSSTEELREMRVLPPREAYEEVEEVYVSHMHLDHMGSLNVPGKVPVYLPSREIAEALSRSWWFGWKQHLLPSTLSFRGFRDIGESGRIRYTQISHSAFPSYAIRIDTEDASIIYTGDFRITSLHSVVGDTLDRFKDLAEGGIDLVIIEGTNFGRRINYLSPAHFRQVLGEVLRKYDEEILFITVHPLDFEATLVVLEELWETGFTPAFTNIYYARILDNIIDVAGYELENELIFVALSSKVTHLNNFEFEFSIKSLKDRKTAFFIPIMGIREIKTIARLLRSQGVLHITITGELAGEEWIAEEKKIRNWLKLLGITSYRIHISGHYHSYQFKTVIQALKPREIIPVHTTAPRTMKELFNKYKSY